MNSWTAQQGRRVHVRVFKSKRDQRGAIAVMAVGVMMMLLLFCGFSLSLGMAYNRTEEMQQVVESVAVAAARQLDGTPAGIDRATAAASSAAGEILYAYRSKGVQWNESAITFGSGPDGGDTGWLNAADAKAHAGAAVFAKVDTSALDAAHGRVNTLFMSTTSLQIKGSAVAARITSNVTPIAVCALSNTRAHSRSGELVEYGFRRGVSYDLMHLNQGATTPANFLINPIAPDGTTGASVRDDTNLVAPFMCTGTMAIPQVIDARLTVERDFPLATFYQHLNSRFGTYVSPCNASTAPPDANVKAYNYLGSVPWMKFAPSSQSAASSTSGGNLWTVADPEPSPGGTLGPAYGPLWAFAKAAKYSSYVPGNAEPATGYATYAPTDWGTLYTPGVPVAQSYPSSPPYRATAGTNFQSPPAGLKSLRNRRVLNVALLECPVPTGPKLSAHVLGVGKFFMTVPATNVSLIGEFAGVASEQSISGEVEVFR